MDSSSATTIGWVAQNIGSGQNGYVLTSGILRGINTTTYAPGTSLYLSSSGQFTSTIPTSPLHEVRLGKTITQAIDGSVFVYIMNGYEIGELHDVLINGKSNGDLLTWDSGSRVWRNTKVLSGSYSISGSLDAPSITGSLLGTSSYAVQALSSSFASTASYLNTLNQNVTVNGNVTINGTASIAYLNVSYESASVIYSSGSNQFGDATNDTQTLIGRTIIKK